MDFTEMATSRYAPNVLLELLRICSVAAAVGATKSAGNSLSASFLLSLYNAGWMGVSQNPDNRYSRLETAVWHP